MTTSDLLTIGGAAVLVSLIVEVIKRTWQWTDETVDRFAPIVSIALGVVVVTVATLSQGGDILQGGLTGILAGCMACGLYDGARSAR
jgi:uncharacterized membrane protein